MLARFAAIGAIWAVFCLPCIAGAQKLIGPAPRGKAWTRHVIDDGSRGADGARLADVNRDGLPDLVTGWEEGGEVRVCLHPGYARVRTKWPVVRVGRVPSPEDAVFVDLDGDGAVDVVSCCEGRNNCVFVHWGPRNTRHYLLESAWRTEAFSQVKNSGRWMFALPLQIDGRFGPDIVIGSKNPGGQVGWLQSPRDPRDISTWQYHKLIRAGWIMSLIGDDMDSDGDTDIVVSDRVGKNSGCMWLEHPGPAAAAKGPWKVHRIGPAGGQVMFIDVVDLDGDGRKDVVAPYHERKLLVHWRIAKGGWKTTSIAFPAKTGTGKAVRVADIDLDGKLDIVLACAGANKGSGIVWLSYRRSVRDVVWDCHELSGPAGIKFDLNQLVDLDGDGDLDVVNTEERTNGRGLGVVWYENPTK